MFSSVLRMKKETTSLATAKISEGKRATNYHQQKNFLPFPHGSINLLVGPSNVGKSTYVANLLQTPDLFFTRPLFQRVVVVNCHSAVGTSQYQNTTTGENTATPVIHCLLSNFEVDILEAGDILIFEDVQEISAVIKLAVTTIVHHLNLSGCFIICHSILGSRLFEILQFCHQVILFLTSSAVSRLALYIVRTFFVDEQLKNYLKGIISTAESQQAILHLSLNPIAGARNPNHLALSHLLNLKEENGGFCIIYPNLRKMKDYEMEDCSSSQQPEFEDTFLEQLPENLNSESYLMINAKSVKNLTEQQQQQQHNQRHNSLDQAKCAENSGEEQWLLAVTELEADIEDSFPAAKIFKAKALARELLKNSSLCLGVNGRTMHFPGKPSKWTFSILDYISTAVRMAGPKEIDKIDNPQYKLYRAVTKSLLNKDCPSHFIKNKILLASSLSQPVKRSAPSGSGSISRPPRGSVNKRDRRAGTFKRKKEQGREREQEEEEDNGKYETESEGHFI